MSAIEILEEYVTNFDEDEFYRKYREDIIDSVTNPDVIEWVTDEFVKDHSIDDAINEGFRCFFVEDPLAIAHKIADDINNEEVTELLLTLPEGYFEDIESLCVQINQKLEPLVYDEAFNMIYQMVDIYLQDMDSSIDSVIYVGGEEDRAYDSYRESRISF